MLMKRSTRRAIFYFSIILFVAVSYVVLLYAQGYQYSFTSRRFIRTGAISLKVNTSATVLLDGVAVKTTSFLTDSASVDSLLPGTYTISVQEKGDSVWQKNVTVQEGFVQDFSHVMILPQTGADKVSVRTEIQNLLYPPAPSPTPAPTGTVPARTPRATPTPLTTLDLTAPYYIKSGSLYAQTNGTAAVIASGISKVFPSDDGKKIAWFKDGKLWVYWLSDTDYQPYHHAGDVVLLGKFSYPVKAAAWFRDSDHLAVDAGNYKVIELDNRGGTNIINF